MDGFQMGDVLFHFNFFLLLYREIFIVYLEMKNINDNVIIIWKFEFFFIFICLNELKNSILDSKNTNTRTISMKW